MKFDKIKCRHGSGNSVRVVVTILEVCTLKKSELEKMNHKLILIILLSIFGETQGFSQSKHT